MSALELLSELRTLGLELWAEGESLRYSAPAGVMTAELKGRIAGHKAEILALLARSRSAEPQAPPIEPISRQGELPLSYSQLRQWFLVELEPASPVYNLPEAVALEGPLQPVELARSLREIARRHEALRTTFESEAGRPRQVIAREPRLPLPLVDLTGLAPPAREEASRALARRHALRVFDLRRGPLVSALLVRRAPAEHWFLLNLHHIVFDRWSMGVFIREMGALYEAFCAGRPSPLPEPRLHYADFAAWQRRWLSGGVLEELLAYWRRRLEGVPPVLPLPLDRPRPVVRTERGGRLRVSLPPSLTRPLQELANRRGGTLFMVLLAAFKALLARYTGRRDLPVGTFIANRNRPEVEDLVGFFVNTLVLRTGLAGDPAFEEILRRVREVTLGAYAHQDLPFEKLLEELSPDREMSYSPFFQVMLVFQNTPAPALRLPGLAVRRLALEEATWAPFDWTLWLWQEGEGMAGYLDYNRDLFDTATLVRMLGHFRRLLAAAGADPGERLSRLPLLAPAEGHQLVLEWNDSRRPGEAPGGVPALFADQMARIPDAVAVAGEEEQLSYGELERRSGRLAHHLRRLGAGPESRVGLFFDRSPAMVTAVVAVLRAGAAYVPVEATSPPERAADLLTRARVTTVVTRGALAPALPDVGAPVVDGDPIAASPQAPAEVPPAPAALERLAYVLFTSGSTGRPKGVMVPGAGLAQACLTWRECYALEPGLHHLQISNFSFDVCTADLARALSSGGRLVLCPLEVLLAPERFHRFLLARGIDYAEMVPALFRPLLRQIAAAGGGGPLPRTLVVGAEAWYVRELQEAVELLPPGSRLINSYGATEATIDSSMFEGRADFSDVESAIPIGRPYANVGMHVVAPDLAPVPAGVTGELLLGGPGVVRGYLDQPALTASQFVPDPLAGPAGGRLYRTGDRARYLPDGNVEFLGRVDHQVKIRGFRIEPGEVEGVLGDHPEVAASVVVPWGEGEDKRLAAYVVPADGKEVDPSGLRSFLKQHLPEYMVPATFTSLPELPLNENRKVDRRRLPAPETDGLEAGELRQPTNPIEEALAEIFAQVLGRERVGIDQSFFELGGHSLLVTRVVARVGDLLHVELPVRALFEAPTVTELAVGVEEMVLAKIEELTDEEVESLL